MLMIDKNFKIQTAPRTSSALYPPLSNTRLLSWLQQAKSQINFQNLKQPSTGSAAFHAFYDDNNSKSKYFDFSMTEQI